MHGLVALFPTFCFRYGGAWWAKRITAITVSTDQVLRDSPVGMQEIDRNLGFLSYLVGPPHDAAAKIYV
jgi:hypothetical protein